MSKGIKSLLKSFIFAILLVAVIRGFFIAPYMVEGESMEPTLHNHDKILVYKVHSAAITKEAISSSSREKRKTM